MTIDTMPSIESYQRPVETEPVRLPFGAEKAAEVYAELGIDREDLFEHAKKTESLVRSFAGSEMPEEAIQMVLVHDVFDRFWNRESSKCTKERQEAAKYVLLDMFTEKLFSEEQVRYCLCILHDMVKVEKASGEHRLHMAKEADTDNGLLSRETISMLSEKYEDVVSKEAWSTTEPYIKFKGMDEFLGGTNIEALVIKACELVDNMRHPSSQRESALLQDVLEAESFYAPILEVIGFDGLASTLRGEAHYIRLMRCECADVLKSASEILDGIEEIGIDTIAEDVFGSWKRSKCLSSVGVDASTGKTPVTVGDLKIANQYGDATVKYRIKTVGSLADKFERYGGEVPKDIVGFTVISADEESSARNFANFIIERMPELTGTRAKNKESSFFVQGSEDYVNTVRKILEAQKDIDMDLIQFKPQSKEQEKNEGHRKLKVSKVTLKTQSGVPVEVQFLTQDERKEARTGEVAHIIYKYFTYLEKIGKQPTAKQKREMIEEAKKVLEDMHERRGKLNPHSLRVNAQSLDGEREVEYALAA